MSKPDWPDFPLHPDVMAQVPKAIPGEWPQDHEQLLDMAGVPK
jgi:hypothetical protein